ncbi:MAG: hypothetical protein PHS17_02630 [Desulfobacterales bacterium]|nr:hypothetical protein [Desulfobacterales bacterium]
MVPRLSISLIALACFAVSCAPARVWESKPAVQEAVNKQFSVSLEPLREGETYFSVFRITVKNNTDADLEIDWNKTRYIHNGRTISGFAFQGIEPSDLKDGTIPSDTVSSGGSFRKDIAPTNLIAFKPLRDHTPEAHSGISAGMIPQGENSVLLVMRQNGKEIRQEVSVRITEVSSKGGVSHSKVSQSRISR